MRRLQVAESAEPPQLRTDDAAAPHDGNGDSSMQDADADDVPTPDAAQPPRTPAPAVTPPVELAAAAGACTGTSA
jgi:hypothetical protein